MLKNAHTYGKQEAVTQYNFKTLGSQQLKWYKLSMVILSLHEYINSISLTINEQKYRGRNSALLYLDGYILAYIGINYN